MKSNRSVWRQAAVVLAGLALLVLCAGLGAQELTAPKYKFDPDWPKTMPNKWKIGGVTGLAVDKDDNVWVLDRPNDLRDMELNAEINLHGRLLHPPSVDDPHRQETATSSATSIRRKGTAWRWTAKDSSTSGTPSTDLNTVRKYDPKTGKLLAEVPRAPETQGGGGGDDADDTPHVPGRGGPGPVGTFPRRLAVAARAVAVDGAIAAAQAG